MEEEKIWRLFAPYFADRVAALQGGLRLVHYTSVENAYRIITGRQVWLRNASMMNDFSEIEHGISCLNAAWGSPVA